ncbi:glycosyltransferase family 2 protein [Arthrobacter sulfonylureivorans]|uniref:glycosyltransferase family 2 protein n=1 Tax=Arthrobacter sulfonylureivorans TaxID=2486855 RepID=UPI0030CE7EC5
MGRAVGARAPPATEKSALIQQQVRVTAVVVAHNGASYLPQTLAALTQQTRPADVYLGVDTGSSDASAELLRTQLPAGTPVTSASGRAGFGAAVRVGLAELPQHAEEGAAVQEWLWLLHDDSAPAPDALEELLLAVETAPSVTIAGCKQVDWDNPRRLVDVGLTVSRWAERLTMIDLDELDQGQYNGRSDFFAVNSAGMLVRRDVFDQLGGFDAALPGTGDDLDLCWRNRLAGHRVVVVPTATVRHATRASDHTTAKAARKAQIHLRLKHAAWWKVPFLWLGALLGGLYSFLASVVAKDPMHGLRQLGATLVALFRPVGYFASRRQAAKTRRTSRAIVRPLMVPQREVWAYRRSLAESLRPELAAGVVGDGSGTDAGSSDQPTGGSDDFAALAAPARTWVGTGLVVAALSLAIVSAVGMFDFFGAPALIGGGLLPLSATVAEIWHNASSWWVSLGSGMSGHGDPFGYVLAVLALLGLGNGSAAVVTLVMLAMPLAAAGAWFAAGALTQRRGLRFWAAIFWASVPAFQVALGTGRLGALIAHLLIPWAVLGLLRATGSAVQRVDANRPLLAHERVHKPGINGNPSWTAAAAAGLCLAGITASAPALLPVAVVFIVILVLSLGRRAKTVWWSLVPPLALALPMGIAALNEPRALLSDPGLPLAFNAAPLWQQLMGFPLAFGPADGLAGAALLEDLAHGPWALVYALVAAVPMLVLAVAGAIGGDGAARARLLWLGAFLTLAASYASSMLATAVAPGAVVTPFTGPFVSVAMFLLLGAALIAGNRMQLGMASWGRSRSGLRRTVAVAAVVLLGLGPVVGLAHWLVPQFTGYTASTEARTLTDFGTQMSVAPGADRTLPATAADRGTGPEQARALVLTAGTGGTVTAAVMHGSGTTLDQLSTIYAARSLNGPLTEAEVGADDDADAELRNTVAVIVAGTGVDPRASLVRLGVDFVVLQESDTAAELLAGRIDAVPGLTSVGRTDAGWLWRVVGKTADDGTEAGAQTARVRLVDANGTLLQSVPSEWTAAGGEIPAGESGRRLILAERKDPGWTATLNGQRLEASADGWAQAFEVPAAAGTVKIGYASPWSPWTGILQVLAIGLTVLLAIPIPARRRFTPRRIDHIKTTGADASTAELQRAAFEDPDDGATAALAGKGQQR